MCSVQGKGDVDTTGCHDAWDESVVRHMPSVQHSASIDNLTNIYSNVTKTNRTLDIGSVLALTARVHRQQALMSLYRIRR